MPLLGGQPMCTLCAPNVHLRRPFHCAGSVRPRGIFQGPPRTPAIPQRHPEQIVTAFLAAHSARPARTLAPDPDSARRIPFAEWPSAPGAGSRSAVHGPLSGLPPCLGIAPEPGRNLTALLAVVNDKFAKCLAGAGGGGGGIGPAPRATRSSGNPSPSCHRTPATVCSPLNRRPHPAATGRQL